MRRPRISGKALRLRRMIIWNRFWRSWSRWRTNMMGQTTLVLKFCYQKPFAYFSKKLAIIWVWARVKIVDSKRHASRPKSKISKNSSKAPKSSANKNDQRCKPTWPHSRLKTYSLSRMMHSCKNGGKEKKQITTTTSKRRSRNYCNALRSKIRSCRTWSTRWILQN